ncbi:MAG TPA: insulinase family protein, partial [Nannocystis exedens]|nr:insulinase family protein [Nannocystis exedens]
FGENLGEAGYWAMSATARDGQSLEEVEGLLMGVRNRLIRGDFSDEDLAAIVLHSEISDKRRIESNSGRVSRMMESYILRTPWADVMAHTDRLRAVTRSDIMRVAKTYLGDDRAVVYRRRGEHSPPAIPKPKITPVPLDPGRRSVFVAELLAQPVEPIEPLWLREGEHYVHHGMPAGPLIAALNRRNDLFSLSYHFEVGSRRRPLLCHALELLELSGTGDLDPAALQRELYRLGTSIDTSCDDEHVTLRVEGIDRNLEASIKLLEDWLREPAFTEATVKSLVANSISQRRDALEDPDFVGAALAAYASLGPMSPYLAKPSNRLLQRTSGKSFARELRDLPNLAHRTLYYGPRPAAEIAKVAAIGSHHRTLLPRPALRYREVKTPTLYFTQKDIAQAKVQIVTPQPPLPTQDRARAALYTQLLSGDMSGLIFQELREARGLAYRAWAHFRRGAKTGDASALIGVLGTQGDKTIDALDLMLTLLQSTPVSKERFVASKTALREDTRNDYIQPRIRPWSVYRWDLQGDAVDPREALLGAISTLDLAALREFAGRFAKTPP